MHLFQDILIGLLIVVVVIIAMVLIKWWKEAREWNNGICPKCREGKWEYIQPWFALDNTKSYCCTTPGCGNQTYQDFHCRNRELKAKKA